jgi:hypothetical protein
MTPLTPQRLQQTIAAIEALDLGPIKFKATRQEGGYGWTPEHADRIEEAYKRYLILHAKYPGLTLAPDQEVDRFWHLHILDTRKYASDCEAVFGHFVHHYPYLGLRGADDAKALQAAFQTTQALYAKEFGDEAVRAPAAWCGADNDTSARREAAWCGIDEGQAPQAAWCGVDSTPAPRGAAWCGVDPGGRHAAEADAPRRPG